MARKGKHPVTHREVVAEGPLLKHKKKKIQGFARRWFVLDDHGILSYAVSPKAPIRDSINVTMASIARSKQHRSIHIDSDRVTWHLRAHTDGDFASWTAALRKFIQVHDRSGGGVDGEQPAEPQANMAEVADLLAKMTAPIQTVQMVIGKMEGSDNTDHSSPKGIAKVGKIFKRMNTDNSENIDQEAEDLRKAHTQIFRYHQRLLEIVSPSKAAGPLAPEEGAAKIDEPLISSRTAIGFGAGRKSIDSDGTEGTYQDAHDFDLDDRKSGYASSAAPSGDDGNTSSATGDDSDSDSDAGEGSSQTSVDEEQVNKGEDDGVKRRDKLPSPSKADPSGAFSVLKNNIGKDLTKISFPVSFNEPLSALQRQAEELEYAILLQKAAAAKGMTEKMAYIGAFAISPLAGTKSRAQRKPFNPLLGETYELIRKDLGFKYFSEKVSHHPPITGFWAQATDEKWTLEGATTASQKYWGRSLEIFPSGPTKLKLGDDDFEWKSRPNATVRGMMGGGEKTIEYNGKLEIRHTKSSAKIVVSFKKGSGWGSGGDANKIEGKIYDDDGEQSGELSGRWDESVSLKTGSDTYKELWKAKALMKESDKYFGFNTFQCQLNETTDDIKEKLPPTDTRKRPDQLAYEKGDADEADSLKEKLENKQRERRKQWEEGGNKGEKPPQWFDKKSDKEFVFKKQSDYWKAREEGKWPDFNPFEA